jgi:hypothetical protein
MRKGHCFAGKLLRQTEWRRVAGMRVVVSWPENGLAPPPRRRRPTWLTRLMGWGGTVLVVGGMVLVGVVLGSQIHAPRPAPGAAGTVGTARTMSVRRSMPLSVIIPAIGVRSPLLRLGRNHDGSMAVPSLDTSAQLAAWYRYSVTPGQLGASVIEGHVDSYTGPGVFFRLGALVPGDHIYVKLADGMTVNFRVTGVRLYLKSEYPAGLIYRASGYSALRVVTCGGQFDPATGHYLGSVVVFAVLQAT